MLRQAGEVHSNQGKTIRSEVFNRATIIERLLAALGLDVDGQKVLFGLEYQNFLQCLDDDLAFMVPSVRKRLLDRARGRINKDDFDILRKALDGRSTVAIRSDVWGRLFATDKPAPVFSFHQLVDEKIKLRLTGKSNSEAAAAEASGRIASADVRQEANNLAEKTVEATDEVQGTVTPAPKRRRPRGIKRVEVEVIPDEVLERIFSDKSTTFPAMIQKTRLAKGLTLVVFTDRVSKELKTTLSPSYFSVLACQLFYVSEDKVRAVAKVLGLKEVWLNRLLEEWRKYVKVHPERGRKRLPEQTEDDAETGSGDEERVTQAAGDLEGDWNHLCHSLDRLCKIHGANLSAVAGTPIQGSLDWLINAALEIIGRLGLAGQEIDYLITVFKIFCPRIVAGISGNGGDVLSIMIAANKAGSQSRVKVITGLSE